MSLTKALETYQACYSGKLITSLGIDQTAIKLREEMLNIKNLSEVTSIAEQQINKGKAVKWYLVKKKGQAVWKITVRKDGRAFDVQVDAYTGKVLTILAKDQ